jgi:hypothetical protein
LGSTAPVTLGGGIPRLLGAASFLFLELGPLASMSMTSGLPGKQEAGRAAGLQQVQKGTAASRAFFYRFFKPG